jgi:hypothetical protein
MAVNLKRLVYFDSFMDPIANAIIGRRDDINLVRLEYGTPEADNWPEMSKAHGYQVQPRGDNLRNKTLPPLWRAARVSAGRAGGQVKVPHGGHGEGKATEGHGEVSYALRAKRN